MKKCLLLLTLAVIVSGCKKELNINFRFGFDRPSSHTAKDGKIFLVSGNQDNINSIEWNWYLSKSTDINIDSLGVGYYFCKITDITGQMHSDSVFMVSLDTIQPEPYFPCYPGSWWLYSDNNTMRCSGKYEKVPVFLEDWPGMGGMIYHPVDSIYAVKVDGVSSFVNSQSSEIPHIENNVAVMGYTFLFPFRPYYSTYEEFFCEDCGSFMVAGYRPYVYGRTECRKVQGYSSILVHGKEYTDVEVINKIMFTGESEHRIKNDYLYYFAKNVGIIKCERKVNGVYLTEYELIDFKINK